MVCANTVEPDPTAASQDLHGLLLEKFHTTLNVFKIYNQILVGKGLSI